MGVKGTFPNMKPLLEVRPWTQDPYSVRVFRRKEPVFEWNWHYHPELELTLITHGRGRRLVGDHCGAYGPGDLVLIGPNLPHTWHSAPGRTSLRAHQAVVIQFRVDAFPPSWTSLPEFRPLARLFSLAARGLHFSAKTSRAVSRKINTLAGREGPPVWLGLAEILTELAGAASNTLASPSYHNRRTYKMGSRLGRVIDHIESQFDQPLTLSDTARVAGLSPTSFARFFRRMTGHTFVDFRNGCRLRHACRQLAETDHGILEIALASGFQNLSHFNRIFRRSLGLSPRIYRQNWTPPAD